LRKSEERGGRTLNSKVAGQTLKGKGKKKKENLNAWGIETRVVRRTLSITMTSEPRGGADCYDGEKEKE